MNRICFDYEDGKNTGGVPIMKRRCFCASTVCQNFGSSKSEICMCCGELECDYSTVGCPWYVNADRLKWLLSRLQSPKYIVGVKSGGLE